MSELWLLMAVTIFLAWFAQRYAYKPAQYPSIRSYAPRKCVVVLIFLILAVYIGMRRYYNDTYTYRSIYEAMATFPVFWDSFSSSIGDNPGFNIVNAFLRTQGISSQNYLMIYSLVTNALYIYFLWKFSPNFPISVFLYFTVGSYTFTGAAIKQSIATAICAAALTFIFKKKYVPYFICILLAATFHPYALMFLFVPLLTYKPWSKWTYIILIAFISAGFLLDSLLGTIVDITTMMGEEYDVSSFSGEGVNVFRVLVCNIPTLLTFMFSKQMFRDTTPQINMMVNLCMINGAIMFVGMFGTANYFARLANYFVIAQTVALPWIVSKFSAKSRLFINTGMIVGYLGYFYYQHGIYQPFERDFSRLTLLEYIKNYLLS